MYPNLRAEMARHNVTMSQVAAALHVQLATLSRKMSGTNDFTLGEARAIKKFLRVDMTIDELFKKADIL